MQGFVLSAVFIAVLATIGSQVEITDRHVRPYSDSHEAQQKRDFEQLRADYAAADPSRKTEIRQQIYALSNALHIDVPSL